MRFKNLMAAAAVTVCCAFMSNKSYATIVITEFINNPAGVDDNFEWIELFNAGPSAVNLAGWTIKDNSTAAFSIPSVEMPSGGYLIIASNKTDFEARWLGGTADSRVVGNDTFNINNGDPGDGLYLRNAAGDLVFSLGFVPAVTEGLVDDARATFLAQFTGRTNYGVPPQDGAALVRRGGEDFPGELGFQLNNVTTDPFAYFVAVGTGGDTGSPLLGGYTAVPEPSCLAALGLGALVLVRRRRNKHIRGQIRMETNSRCSF
jgi:hypothetical protein